MFVRKLLMGISKPAIRSLTFAHIWSLNRWPYAKLRAGWRYRISLAIICFLRIFRSYYSLSSTLKKQEACIFDKIFDFLFKFKFFHLEDIDLGSPKFYVLETFDQTTFHKKIDDSSLHRSWVGRGGRFCPPFHGVILDPIPLRGLSSLSAHAVDVWHMMNWDTSAKIASRSYSVWKSHSSWKRQYL